MTALLVLSGVLELIGLICAGFGFRATWHEHARGEKFFEPMGRPVTTWARSVSNRVRTLLRRPGRPQDVQLVPAELTLTPSALRPMTSLPAPPDPAVDLTAYADVVTERINHLHEEVQNQRHDMAAEVEARETAIRQAQTALTAKIDAIRQLSVQVAVGGLRLQFVGWLFLLAGIVIGTIANIIGS